MRPPGCSKKRPKEEAHAKKSNLKADPRGVKEGKRPKTRRLRIVGGNKNRWGATVLFGPCTGGQPNGGESRGGGGGGRESGGGLQNLGGGGGLLAWI